jgi:hypothetical protein
VPGALLDEELLLALLLAAAGRALWLSNGEVIAGSIP